jgi:hypothetical protein
MMISAVTAILADYKTQVDRARLVKALAQVTPDALIEQAKGLGEATSQKTGDALKTTLIMIYDKGAPQDKRLLPMGLAA